MTRLRICNFILLTLTLLCFVSTARAQGTNNKELQRYNDLAIDSFNQYRFDKAEVYCDSALKIQDNVTSRYTIAYIENYKNNHEVAIEHALRAIELDSSFLLSYAVLFNAYYETKQWDNAFAIAEKAKKGDREGIVSTRISYVITARQYENISKIILWSLFLIVALLYLLPSFRSAKQQKLQQAGSQPGILPILFLSTAVSLFMYTLFFSVAKFIWSTNPKLSLADITPLIRIFIYQHDGFESLALYALVFISIFLSVILSGWLVKFISNPKKAPAVALVLLAGYYVYQVGLTPPTIAFQKTFESGYLLLVVALVGIALLLFLLNAKSKLFVRMIIVVLIAFVSLVPAYSNSANDLAYIFAPALRLKNGAKFSEIYFQYDIFLSLLALLWFKLNLALESFPYLAQLSFFLFFIGSLIFADCYFKTKGLSTVFIIALIVTRYYAVWEEQYSIFQVSPMRLDLWLILLLAAYFKGIRHWLTGLCLGLLILFHRNLGVIYMISYLLLIFFLFLFDIVSARQQKTLSKKYFSDTLLAHLKSGWINLSLVAIAIVSCFILTGEIFSSSAIIYREYGIGMLPIARSSFYWWVLILLSALSVLLVQYKKKLTDRYFGIALFILLIAIGNSMYFFGRSHENNILNISGILVLCLFIVFDILIFLSSTATVNIQKTKTKSPGRPAGGIKRVYLLLPFLFILLTALFYAPRVNEKLSNQLNNLQTSHFTFPLLAQSIDTTTIKQLTHGSEKVLFLDFDKDFYYYYYGQYKPVGLYNPVNTSVFKKDLLGFLQHALDDHYYIVANTNKFDYPYEYLPALDYNYSAEKNNLLAISKDSTARLLPNDRNELLHIAIKPDTASHDGIYHKPLSLARSFTIEVLFKPVGQQSTDATLISNWTNIGGLYGFVLQAGDTTAGQYNFVLGGGPFGSQNIIFTMENNQWHYLTIAVSNSSLTVYDWGKQIAATHLTISFENSNEPLIIGNSAKRDARFAGSIREIKITNGVNESAILETAGAVSKQLAPESY